MEFNVTGKHVLENATVWGDAAVSGNARVLGNARVWGDAQVWGDARVSGDARIYGIIRSDGYCFVYVPCEDGEWRVIAGCRYFTMAEARTHWMDPNYRDAKLAHETLVILECLEKLRVVKPEGV